MSKRKIMIMIGSLVFSFGVLSIGYGFWTDKLDIEGKANVIFSVNVKDDVIEEEAITPEAIELVVNPELGSGENGDGGSVVPPTDNTTNIIEPKPAEPKNTDPGITPPPAETQVQPETPAPDPEPAPVVNPAPDPEPAPVVNPDPEPEPEPEVTSEPEPASQQENGGAPASTETVNE